MEQQQPVAGGESLREESQPIQSEDNKKKNSELKKILREDSSWSLKTIVITSLTGVSVAVISSQLTGLVSSIVLIGVMAFVTATISEIYRIFISLTGLGAKKAAEKAGVVKKAKKSAQDNSPQW